MSVVGCYKNVALRRIEKTPIQLNTQNIQHTPNQVKPANLHAIIISSENRFMSEKKATTSKVVTNISLFRSEFSLFIF